MKRCHGVHSLRCAATSGRGDPIRKATFCVSGRAEPASSRSPISRRRCRARQLLLDFGQRDALARRRQLAQQIGVGRQACGCRRSVTERSNLSRAHKLDRRRRTHLEAARRRPRRVAGLDGARQSPPQILGRGAVKASFLNSTLEPDSRIGSSWKRSSQSQAMTLNISYSLSKIENEAVLG